MRNLKIVNATFFLLLFCGAITAHAQTAQRTFVSTAGNDANTATLCSATNPCRTFASAMSVTSTNGEVIALTSGGYGSIAITKAIQITAPTGVYVAITAASGDAININVGASDKVVLRGLTLNSLGATNGINFQTGRTLHIENCIINGFTDAGINVSRGIANDTAELFIKDTIVRNGGIGIFLLNSGANGLVQASIDTCRFEKNTSDGVWVRNNGRVTVRNSVAANNRTGFKSQSLTAGQTAELNLENCVAANNEDGLYSNGVNGTALIRVSNSTITNNTDNGIIVGAGGQILSRGNNTVEGNTSSNVFPAGSTITAK